MFLRPSPHRAVSKPVLSNPTRSAKYLFFQREPDDKPGSVMRQAASDRHSSRSAVARALKQPTRKAVAGPTAFPIWSCSERGMPSMPRRRGIWWALAPPFHPYPAPKSAGRPEKGLASFVPFWVRGGLLSVALSEGRPSWVLPSVLPCGARTFLSGRNGPQRRSVRLPHFFTACQRSFSPLGEAPCKACRFCNAAAQGEGSKRHVMARNRPAQ